MLGQHLLKIWSKTQSLVALSSGESELYAALKASAEGLGMKSVALRMGATKTCVFFVYPILNPTVHMLLIFRIRILYYYNIMERTTYGMFRIWTTVHT